MKNAYDILIAGGGMVGNTLAVALAGSGLRIGVIEPQGAPEAGSEQDLRVSAITLASQTIFENLGVWESMRRQRAAPIEKMRVREDQGVLDFDSAEIGEACLAWIIENRVVVAALAGHLRQHPNVTLFTPARVESVDFHDESVTVRLTDGSRLTSRLLVGADGARSRVRSAAAIGWTQHDLAQSAIVAMVQTGQPHGRTAFQNFLPTGPLAFLPLDDPRRVSIVWSADTARAAQLMALDDTAFDGELQAAFGETLGPVRLASTRILFPLALGFARDYTRARIALVGDAAHTVHPLAGQGVNLGILDAAMLAEVLHEAVVDKRDPGAPGLLRRYARARQGADTGMQLVTGGFRYFFGSRWPGLSPVRVAGLRMVNGSPLLKDFFMRRASGLAGELPELAQRVLR